MCVKAIEGLPSVIALFDYILDCVVDDHFIVNHDRGIVISVIKATTITTKHCLRGFFL